MDIIHRCWGTIAPSRAKHRFMNHIVFFTLIPISVVGLFCLDPRGLSRCQNPEGLYYCVVVGSINLDGVREACESVAVLRAAYKYTNSE